MEFIYLRFFGGLPIVYGGEKVAYFIVSNASSFKSIHKQIFLDKNKLGSIKKNLGAYLIYLGAIWWLTACPNYISISCVRIQDTFQ